MNDIDWSDPGVLGRYLYDFAMAIIIAVPGWKADEAMRGRLCDALPGAVHPKAVSIYAEEYRMRGTERNFAEVV